MRLRRNRADTPHHAETDADDVEMLKGAPDDASDPDDAAEMEEAADPDDPAEEDDAAEVDVADADALDTVDADADEEAADDAAEDEFDDPEPTGRFAWLRPRKRKIDYGPDFTVKVATLPDLERFPEDGHVHPEIVRSWMALQQFGEALLLVSWVERTPAGYVLVSWTGDWNDEVRAEYPDTPALCNLWADEQYTEVDVERLLIEAAIKICEKQSKPELLATIEAENSKVRAELDDLGFDETGMTISERFVYRDADGKKRRGTHENLVLLKKL